MTEIKRHAEVGESIKVTKEYPGGWKRDPYPLDSIWVVRRIVRATDGMVACEGNEFCISASDYIVLEK